MSEKGVSRETINHVIVLILLIFFLTLVIIFFREKGDEVRKIILKLFHW